MTDETKVKDLQNQIKQLQDLNAQFCAQVKQLTCEKLSHENSHGELYQNHHKVKTQVFLNQQSITELSDQLRTQVAQLEEVNKKWAAAEKKVEEMNLINVELGKKLDEMKLKLDVAQVVNHSDGLSKDAAYDCSNDMIDTRK